MSLIAKIVFFVFSLVGVAAAAQPKPPTEATIAVLEQAEKNRPVGDFSDGARLHDFSPAQLIVKFPPGSGRRALPAMKQRPPTLHPNLFEFTQYHLHSGALYKLSEGVYQIQGDLAELTLLRGKSGWIVLDTGLSAKFVRAAWGIARQYLPGGASVPISAIIYSHSHADHFGGVAGLLTPAEVKEKGIDIIAPYGFMNEVVSENILVGPIMDRRSEYPFGALLLPANAPAEAFSIIPPTVELPFGPGKITEREVDGVNMLFKDISGAEAPSATLIYVPKNKMLFNAELTAPLLHNIYTLRGAKARDALLWSKYIHQIIHTWGDEVELLVGPHGPTLAGKERIIAYLSVQRDNYGFLHNQVVRLLNNGVTMQDMGQALQEIVPQNLSELWHTHGFHGTYSHNARGVVNRYVGFYDGNPASLNPLQSIPEAEKFVAYMGGADAVVKRARQDFERGEYRFVATALNKVVTAQPSHTEASALLADTFEQLGYQSEGPQWRNAYLSAALELRAGKVLVFTKNAGGSELVKQASVEQILDVMAVRFNGANAADLDYRFTLSVADVGEFYLVEIKHGNLSSIQIEGALESDAKLTVDKKNITALLNPAAFKSAIKMGAVTVDGDRKSVMRVLDMIELPASSVKLVPVPG